MGAPETKRGRRGAPLLFLHGLQPVTRSTTVVPISLIASTPATTADCACCATSCATRVTRAIGVCLRGALAWRDVPPLDDLLACRVVLLRADLVPAALRDVALLALRFFAPRAPLVELRLDAALRERLDALREDADFRPLDLLLFDLPLLALRDEALLPDFPRDFLALVAIDASPRRQWYENHLDDSKNQAHP